MKQLIILLILVTFGLSSCESYLDIMPDDRITEDEFWKSKDDAYLSLYGVYNILKRNPVYGYGGGYDACTPNAYQWAHWEGQQMQVGSGQITSGSGGIVSDRWRDCYEGINRANYFLEHINEIDMDEAEKNKIISEVRFLRGVFYHLLASSYGGVPIILNTITSAEARTLKRETEENIWSLVHKEYDEALKYLPKNADALGRIDQGAALGMKMKAYLYKGNWAKVLEYCDKIEALNKYKLFPSYYGLFQFENEGNSETIFSLCFMEGEFKQGSVFDRYWQPQNLPFGIDGSNSVAPTQLLVDIYETIDGSPINASDPYSNRDPRLDFTVLRPGAYFQGQLYPDSIQNHNGQKVGFGIRKYTIETMKVKGNQSPLDFMILRYADVLLCKAEAMIELNTNIDDAIAIVNRIRTERTDVKITKINSGLSQTEAREVVRKERRIELALEGQYWDDIKRWNAGPQVYPAKVIGALGELIQTKFPEGYNVKRDNYLPIPDSERSLNKNLEQNFGY